MAKANRFAKNDEGVSAVIGVILMVAITVILAAVIAAFVFGMVGGVGQKKNPAFTVKRISNGSVEITLQDKGGATAVYSTEVTTPSCTNSDTSTETLDLKVGDTITLTGFPGDTSHLVVTAIVDGNTQVVIDTNV